jgi:ribosomal protein S18 acetylase RimI-like enzyme
VSEKLTIRPMRLSDIVPLHKLYFSLPLEVKKVYRVHILRPQTGPLWLMGQICLVCSLTPMLKTLVKGIFPKMLFIVVIGENVSGAIIGMCHLRINRRLANKSFTADLGIYVGSSQNGRGYGSLMLQKLIELARKENIAFVDAPVVKTNEIALEFFRRHGFKIIGERKSFRFLGIQRPTYKILRLDINPEH